EPGDPIGPNQSLLGGRYLPSAMLGAFAAIHTGARFLDDWKRYDGHFRGQINDTMSLDDQAALAACRVTPSTQEAELIPRATAWLGGDVSASLSGTDASPEHGQNRSE